LGAFYLEIKNRRDILNAILIRKTAHKNWRSKHKRLIQLLENDANEYRQQPSKTFTIIRG